MKKIILASVLFIFCMFLSLFYRNASASIVIPESVPYEYNGRVYTSVISVLNTYNRYTNHLYCAGDVLATTSNDILFSYLCNLSFIVRTYDPNGNNVYDHVFEGQGPYSSSGDTYSGFSGDTLLTSIDIVDTDNHDIIRFAKNFGPSGSTNTFLDLPHQLPYTDSNGITYDYVVQWRFGPYNWRANYCKSSDNLPPSLFSQNPTNPASMEIAWFSGSHCHFFFTNIIETNGNSTWIDYGVVGSFPFVNGFWDIGLNLGDMIRSNVDIRYYDYETPTVGYDFQGNFGLHQVNPGDLLISASTFAGGGPSTGASATINRITPLDGGLNVSGASQTGEGTNVVKFGIEVRDDNGATVNYEATPNEDGTFSKVIEGLTNGLRYFVKVFTVDAAQAQGPASAPVSVTPQAAPQDAKEWGSNQLPVLLLHGFRSNGDEWATMAKALNNIGIPVDTPTFDTISNENLCLEAVELEGILTRFKNATGRSKVIVIGHSQGGVVARAYMQFGPKPSEFSDRLLPYVGSLNHPNGQQGTACYDAFDGKPAFYNRDIAKLITYGTPHKGADACTLGACNAYSLLRPGNGLLALLNSFDLFPLPENLSIVNLRGRTNGSADDDCVVSTSSQDMRDQSNGYYVAGLEVPDTVDWVRHYTGLGCKTLFFRTPEKEDIHSIFKHGLGAPEYVVRALSPVDLIVVDPEYRTISKDKREIWGAVYEEQTDDSGHKTDVIRIPFPVSGNYQITVVPDPGAAPTETFSIETELSGVTTRLVENMPIQNIPEQPFAVAVDVTPDPFSFVEQTGVARNRVINSNVVTVSGINQPAVITILGGEYSVNGGAYTSGSGLVNNSDTVSVRHTSAATYDTATDTVLSIGGYSDVFTSTTMPECVSTPALTVTLTPNRLWPPNHKMVTVTANVQASDTCDPNPTVTLVSITSNEPDNGLGDGDTPNDIQNAAFGTDDRTFALRAERSGTGTGRIYTITYQATNSAGKTSAATAQVVVPHDQGK